MSLARTSGFTLVELMVVMVIIGIMSIVIMTVYTSVTSLSATLSAQRILASTARDIVDRISTDMQEQKILAYTPTSIGKNLYTDEYTNLYTGSGNHYIGFANHLYILAKKNGTILQPCTGTGCYVYRVNGSNWQDAVNIVDTFVPDEAKKRVHIDDMRWYVSGNGGNSGEQKVTVVMKLSLTRYSGAPYSVIRDTHLDIQTTISSRGTRK